jgi:Flp pilus assembly protein TadG
LDLGMPIKVCSLISRFAADTRANMAIIFALAILPILAAIGCATDYSRANQMKAKLQSAADAASVTPVSKNSAGYKAAILMSSDGSVAAGVTEANAIFNGNASSFSGYSNLSIIGAVTKTGATLNSTVQFSASMPTMFLGVLGFNTLTLSGSSTSSAGLPLYVDFYLLLDVSGSMGLPSTTSEAQRLQAVSPDLYTYYTSGCTFACHFSAQWSCWSDSVQGYPTNGGYCLGYAITRVSQSGYKALLTTNKNNPMGVQLPNSIVSGLPNSLNSALTPVSNCSSPGTDSCIQLRLDAVGYAVNQMLSTANSREELASQYRIGLYPFIQYLYSYFPLTSSINGSATNTSTINYAAANLASLLDTNTNTNLGSGGTHIDTALSSVSGLITTVGTGASWNNTLPYVFLITDGAQDNQTKGVPNGSWSGSNQATVINPSTTCTPLKNRGITVAVLYIPYQPISPVNSSFSGDEDTAANNNIPNIPASLQGCASPGFFYTANSPTDITNALNAMFIQAVTTAHIKS